MPDQTNGNRICELTKDSFFLLFGRLQQPFFLLFGRLQQPVPSFPHKPFSLAVALILGYLQVASQGKGFNSSPALYYIAVTGFLTYCLASGFEIVSSSHPLRPMPEAASNVLHRCMFLAASLSFPAMASFLFTDSIRAFMFAGILTIISAVYLLYSVYPFQAINIRTEAVGLASPTRESVLEVSYFT